MGRQQHQSELHEKRMGGKQNVTTAGGGRKSPLKSPARSKRMARMDSPGKNASPLSRRRRGSEIAMASQIMPGSPQKRCSIVIESTNSKEWEEKPNKKLKNLQADTITNYRESNSASRKTISRIDLMSSSIKSSVERLQKLDILQTGNVHATF